MANPYFRERATAERQNVYALTYANCCGMHRDKDGMEVDIVIERGARTLAGGEVNWEPLDGHARRVHEAQELNPP